MESLFTCFLMIYDDGTMEQHSFDSYVPPSPDQDPKTVVAVSVDYRLAPKNPLPIAYEDCRDALQWVAYQGSNKDSAGDFDRLYIGGDNAGGNIGHDLAMRAGVESLSGGVKILGAYLGHPFFWSSKPIMSEPKGEDFEKNPICKFWDFVYLSSPGRIDNPMVNPTGPGGKEKWRCLKWKEKIIAFISNLRLILIARSHRQFSHILVIYTSSLMASIAKELAFKSYPFIRIFEDGTVERIPFPYSSYVPPSPDQDPETGVYSKDITISDNPKFSARLFLPNLPQNQTQKLSILVYFHGGAFCMASTFSFLHQRYLNRLVSEAKVIAVSVEYRLAPENPLPIAYEDCWAALQWVASHSINKGSSDGNKETWLLNYGDFDRVYIGGDSAGGNIAHNLVMKAGVEGLCGGVKILGAFLSCPYFWGSKPIGSEPKGENFEKTLPYLVWDFVYPSAPGGIDNPMVNPAGEGAPSLTGLGCSKLLVCVAGKDHLRDRGVQYYDLVKESGWKGELELFEVEGEDHCFHVSLGIETKTDQTETTTENVTKMFKRLASFLLRQVVPSSVSHNK
ncbi:unnamed protein product [Malus baccata var. baccata]